MQPKKNSLEYENFVKQIKRLDPDLIIVCSYSMLLHPDILEIPSMGAVNIHGALLPEYRGCNPIQWALINDESETGVTMHYMSAGFDSGDIVAQKRVPILDDDTWVVVLERIGVATDQLLEEQIPKLLSGTNNRSPQDEHYANYFRRRKPEDGQFEWTWKARQIYNLIRALVKPHPGAFYYDRQGLRTVIDHFIPFEQVKEMQLQAVGKVIE